VLGKHLKFNTSISYLITTEQNVDEGELKYMRIAHLVSISSGFWSYWLVHEKLTSITRNSTMLPTYHHSSG
jgi:hypothetical protein